jgi:hypothetical protein
MITDPEVLTHCNYCLRPFVDEMPVMGYHFHCLTRLKEPRHMDTIKQALQTKAEGKEVRTEHPRTPDPVDRDAGRPDDDGRRVEVGQSGEQLAPTARTQRNATRPTTRGRDRGRQSKSL